MRYLFIIILIIHGLIHLLGFLSAFFSTEFKQQVLRISKPIGSIWLITCILFMVSASQFLTHKKWFYVAFIAVLVSQILIIMTWKDAKYGTIINVLIFLVAGITYKTNEFQQMVRMESDKMMYSTTFKNSKKISESDLETLPKNVQKWLNRSNVVGREFNSTLTLKQKGAMRIKPSGKWMPFKATQHINTKSTSFIWYTTVEALPLVSIVGRDKLVEGKGEMLIKLASLFPVVNEKSNYKLNQGAMVRYLAEICWFPSAALHDSITWKPIDDTTSKATYTYQDQSVSGIFSFTTEGDFKSFEAQRYYGGKTDAKLESWYVEAIDYKHFDDVRIPNKNKVTWRLANGDFHWLTLEITEVVFKAPFNN